MPSLFANAAAFRIWRDVPTKFPKRHKLFDVLTGIGMQLLSEAEVFGGACILNRRIEACPQASALQSAASVCNSRSVRTFARVARSKRSESVFSSVDL